MTVDLPTPVLTHSNGTCLNPDHCSPNKPQQNGCPAKMRWKKVFDLSTILLYEGSRRYKHTLHAYQTSFESPHCKHTLNRWPQILLTISLPAIALWELLQVSCHFFLSTINILTSIQTFCQDNVGTYWNVWQVVLNTNDTSMAVWPKRKSKQKVNVKSSLWMVHPLMRKLSPVELRSVYPGASALRFLSQCALRWTEPFPDFPSARHSERFLAATGRSENRVQWLRCF